LVIFGLALGGTSHAKTEIFYKDTSTTWITGWFGTANPPGASAVDGLFINWAYTTVREIECPGEDYYTIDSWTEYPGGSEADYREDVSDKIKSMFTDPRILNSIEGWASDIGNHTTDAEQELRSFLGNTMWTHTDSWSFTSPVTHDQTYYDHGHIYYRDLDPLTVLLTQYSYYTRVTLIEVNALSGNSLAPVPEPSTMLLLGTGLAGLFGFKRRKRDKA
jgi:hypothetical protein